MKPKGILEACLYVEDLDQAEEFYSRALELTPFAKVEQRHIFFRCGNSVFLVFNPNTTEQPGGEVPTHGARGPGHLAFRMEESEVDDWRQFLAQRGIEIEAEVVWPRGGHSIYFRDPAGNSLELATPTTWGLRMES